MKDNFHRQRFPLLTVALLAVGLAMLIAGVLHGGVLLFALNAACLAIFGQSVEDMLHKRRFAALVLLCALVGIGLQLAIGQAGSAVTFGLYGAVAAVAGAYLALRPAGRVFTVVLAPMFSTVVAVPAVALIAAWIALVACVGAFGIATSLPSDGARWATMLGLALIGLVIARPLARHEAPEPFTR